MLSVSEIDSPSDIACIQEKSSPVILRNLVSDWPLVEKANSGAAALRNYLLSFDVGRPFQAMIAPSSQEGRLFYKPDLSGFNFDRLNGDLSEALKILESLSDKSCPPTFYVGSKNIEEYLPGLNEETPLPLLPHSIVPNIWFGNASVVATHNDLAHNIACAGAGRRRFTLFPPDQEKNLYLGPEDMTPAGRPISLVDLKAPDFNKFPLFRQALKKAQVAELSPGDALYIPPLWWHHVESLAPINILVNFWW